MTHLQLVPCQKCKNWFDLNDGWGSKKWYPGTVICDKCYEEEEREIEKEEEIEDLKMQINDAEDTIKNARNILIELGVDVPTVVWTPFY